MKTSLTPHELKITFCTVSGSLLLCSSMEAHAGSAADETTWYRADMPVMTLPVTVITPGPLPLRQQSSRLITEDLAPSAWDELYGRSTRRAQTDALASGYAMPGGGSKVRR